jgi:hypothetical protein
MIIISGRSADSALGDPAGRVVDATPCRAGCECGRRSRVGAPESQSGRQMPNGCQALTLSSLSSQIILHWKCESPAKIDGESAFPLYAAVIW